MGYCILIREERRQDMSKEIKTIKTIQSVHRALDILEYLVTKGDGEKLAAIAENCGLNKTTAFHLIKTLELRGYLEQSPDSLYYKTGGKMFELSLKAYQNINLNVYCQPYMEKLVEEFNETVGLYHFAKINGHTQSLCTLCMESTLPVKVSFTLGKWTPLSCTAYGKLYLSRLNGQALEDALAQDECPEPLRPARDILNLQFSEARKNSYVIEREEYEEGVVNIAVPIYKYTGRVIAALCTAVPVQRAENSRLENIVRVMRKMSAELSAIPL